jgi:hypothetical protein
LNKKYICTYTKGREDFIPPWTEESLLLLASNEAAFDGEYWHNRSHVAWSTVYGAIYHSPSTVAKCVSHLHEYINA